MNRDDIKAALKKGREWEPVGSFFAGVLVVALLFSLGAAIMIQLHNQIKNSPDRMMSNQAKPTPYVLNTIEQMPKTPPLKAVNGEWHAEGLPAKYIVHSGDSTWVIAQAMYGAGENYVDIEKANDLQPNQQLVEGQEIVLPDVASKIDRPVPVTHADGTRTHVVQKSEGLWQIAQQYYGDGNQYMKIYDANKDQMKSPDDIHEGMELIIPE